MEELSVQDMSTIIYESCKALQLVISIWLSVSLYVVCFCLVSLEFSCNWANCISHV